MYDVNDVCFDVCESSCCDLFYLNRNDRIDSGLFVVLMCECFVFILFVLVVSYEHKVFLNALRSMQLKIYGYSGGNF